MKKGIYSKEHKRLVGQLKKARHEAGLDQNEAARKLGTTQSYISKLESGQRKVDVMHLKELARVYKKSVDYFIK
jgi:transcriptional regulator with XRE-family HTH domain